MALLACALILRSKRVFDKYVSEEVAIYKWPERLMIVDQIPRTPLGKVQKALLKGEAKGIKGDVIQRLMAS
jgi:acyl-CoA synthetase (AMP-forming)/AMP-acid ligase II